MERRVLLQPAYVLHTQAFQNTSLLVDFFVMEHGRVRAIAQGARREKSRLRGLLQSFHPLLVSFAGRGEMKTVTAVETNVAAIHLQGERLFSGLYLNELMTRLLQGQGDHRRLFLHYQDTLLALAQASDLHAVLRAFELGLLEDLGYGINLEHDCVSHAPIEAERHYLFVPDMGFEALPPGSAGDLRGDEFIGRHLIDLRQGRSGDEDSRRAARRLLRLALGHHLGERPLHSRALFQRTPEGSG